MNPARMGDLYSLCPKCGSHDTYYEPTHKRRHSDMHCRSCGWTSDHTIRQLRESFGRDPDTGEKLPE